MATFVAAIISRRGIMGIGWAELLIILAIVLVIFGAKRLKSLGSDIGGAIKSFKESMKDEEDKGKSESADAKAVDSPSGEKKKLN
jgi:sec-independent protein translocase protein TatA